MIEHSPSFLALLDIQRRYQIRLVIGGSFPMRDLRPIHDFDVCVHPDDFPKLFKVREYTREFSQSEYGNLRCELRGRNFDFPVEMFNDAFPEGFGYTDLEPQGYEDFHGVPCWTINQCIAWKKAFGRDKDLEDIQRIADLVEESALER